MKESSSESTRAIYDVVLLHPMAQPAHHSGSNTHYVDYDDITRNNNLTGAIPDVSRYPLGSHKYRIEHELVLQWKTTQRKLNTDTLPCSRILRVSPLDLRSSPSICLMKHVCSGKTVTLITPDLSTFEEGKIVKPVKASAPIPATHILLQHHGEVLLRELHEGMPFKDLPLAVYANNPASLRIKVSARACVCVCVCVFVVLTLITT